MLKAMISQPMRNVSARKIKDVRLAAKKALEAQGYEVVNTLWGERELYIPDDAKKNKPLFFLAQALERMAECDAVYFCKGWRDARGCCMEHAAARHYGLERLYEEDEADG